MFPNVTTTELIYIISATIAIILSNIGARFIQLDWDEHQLKMLSHPYARILYIYSMAFVGSRNYGLAALITLGYYLILMMSR
jgi:hypothetical protein